MSSLTRGLLALTLIVALTTPVRAGNWETPSVGGTTSGQPEVLFTFDDGPHQTYTGWVLDILAKHHVQAMFFMTGDHFEGEPTQVERYRKVLARVLREGHIVANHTMNHKQLCGTKEEVASYEIDATTKLLEQEAGMKVPWFRAPYGAWCPRLVRMLAERQLTHFYWDIDPQEWRTNNAKTTEWKITRALKRLKGRAMVLLHDIHLVTVKALPKILEWIEAENARRTKAGQPTIRIVNGPEYAAELLGEEVVAEARALASDLIGGLASGLSSTLP